MNWTSPADLKRQVQRLWDRGRLLTPLAGGEDIFPKRLVLKKPGTKELSERFSDVKGWIADLSSAASSYRIVWQTINHRVLGMNQIPAEIWVDTLDDALTIVGKKKRADTFGKQVTLTRKQLPELIPWLAKRPLRALELATDWPQLLAFVDWVRQHPRPDIYLRQVDLPGIHTKLIEAHRGVLAELLDLVLPENAIDTRHTGVHGFCRRYGFREKPLRVRFRLLDTDQDITLTQSGFATMNPAVSTVFITENEINFLAFPPVPQAMIIFGAGYGFKNLATAQWLPSKTIYYWGDIDTHGFAILNQLRTNFPQAVSLLMDQQTLLAHRHLWGSESQPQTADLPRLTDHEHKLYNQLRGNFWGPNIRLEQERVAFSTLQQALPPYHDTP